MEKKEYEVPPHLLEFFKQRAEYIKLKKAAREAAEKEKNDNV